MCITYPGLVLGRDGSTAVVEMTGRARRASTLLVPDIAVGDWVMVGVGAILRRLDPAEAIDLVHVLDAARTATADRTASPANQSHQPAQGGRP